MKPVNNQLYGVTLQPQSQIANDVFRLADLRIVSAILIHPLTSWAVVLRRRLIAELDPVAEQERIEQQIRRDELLTGWQRDQQFFE